MGWGVRDKRGVVIDQKQVGSEHRPKNKDYQPYISIISIDCQPAVSKSDVLWGILDWAAQFSGDQDRNLFAEFLACVAGVLYYSEGRVMRAIVLLETGLRVGSVMES